MLHEIIKTARKDAKISQTKLSQLTGISTDRLTSIENGAGKLSLTEFEQYLQAIGLFTLILPNKYKP